MSSSASNSFRLLFGLLLAIMIVVGGISFYNYATSPTDENLFADPPSRAYIQKSVPGVLLTSDTVTTGKHQYGGDSLLIGDLLLAVNGRNVKTLRETETISTLTPADELTLVVLRLSSGKKLTFRAAGNSISRDFVRDLPHVVRVLDVDPGGASDRAGMKVGDLIVRINNETFTNAWEADGILRRGQTGKSIRYEIIRDNKHLQLDVTLAKFGVRISHLAFLVAGITYIAVGSFIVFKRSQLHAARLVGLFLTLIGFFIATLFVRRDAGADLFTLLRDGLSFGALFAGLAVWQHSSAYFPKERPEMISRKWTYVVAYAIAVVGVVIGATSEATGGVPFLFALAMMVYGIVVKVILWRGRSAEYGKLNRPLMYLVSAAGILTVGFGLFLNTNPGLPSQSVAFFAVIFLLIPFAYLYTIGRFRLLDLNLRMRRNIQYSVVTAVWAIAVIVIAGKLFFVLPELHLGLPGIVFRPASIEVSDEPLSADEQALLEKVAVMVLGIALVYGAWKIRRVGQKLIDRKYYRAQYDYQRAASELAEVLATRLGMVDLARGLVQKLADHMQLKQSGVLFFRDENVCCCLEAYGFEGTGWREFCVSESKGLVHEIQKFHGEFRVDYLPSPYKEVFRKFGVLYLIPIRSKETLIGTLMIGEKLSESTLRQEDLAFLSSAAKQASVAIENAFLYEELAEKARLKHELGIARRIQLASLPQVTPDVKGLDISGISLPASEVGGDFYDYLNGQANRVTVVVGDVSGKGTSAALYMSKVQGILRSLYEFNLSPADLFTRANRLLCRELEKNSYITALGAEIDVEKKSLVFARAGHLPLYYYCAASGQVEKITPRGLGLGLNDAGLFSRELEERSLRYEPADILLFVTDGVTEARNSDGFEFSEQRLIEVVQAYSSSCAQELRDLILDSVKQFSGDAYQHDDQTVVVVKAG